MANLSFILIFIKKKDSIVSHFAAATEENMYFRNKWFSETLCTANHLSDTAQINIETEENVVTGSRHRQY